MNELKDITNEFIEKKKTNVIDSAKMIDASGHALIEARNWKRCADIIEKNNSKYYTQESVMLMFSNELFLKTILLSNKIDYERNHKIKDLYDLLSKENKEKIKSKFNKKIEVDLFLFDEKIVLSTFEEQLNFISNDFISLRYNFEKLINGQAIIVLGELIKSLNDILFEIAKDEYSKAIENNKQQKQ